VGVQANGIGIVAADVQGVMNVDMACANGGGMNWSIGNAVPAVALPVHIFIHDAKGFAGQAVAVNGEKKFVGAKELGLCIHGNGKKGFAGAAG